MNARYVFAAAVSVIAATVATPAMAHHSFAMFDHAKEVELKNATVVEWQWTSPHAWLFLLVPDGTSEPVKYSVECANPGVLRRLGYGKGTLSAGDKVTAYISPLRDGQKGGALNAIVLPDGKMLGAHLVAQ